MCGRMGGEEVVSKILPHAQTPKLPHHKASLFPVHHLAVYDGVEHVGVEEGGGLDLAEVVREHREVGQLADGDGALSASSKRV